MRFLPAHQLSTALKLLEWVREDAPFWDLTTEALVPEDVLVEAHVIAREGGVAACLKDLAEALRTLGLDAEVRFAEGEPFRAGDTLMIIRGSAREVLLIERTLLNIMSHILGVARATRELVEEAREVSPKVRVAATRKVMPGLRTLVKRAVRAGGGDTHRLSLSDAILIKDNHLAVVGDVAKAVRAAREAVSFTHKVEVEVESIEDALRAAEAGADIIMLDNMSPDEVREAVKALEEAGLRASVIVEASGGIGPHNIREYAATGVDVVSTSYITMKAPPLDLSMEVVRVWRDPNPQSTR